MNPRERFTRLVVGAACLTVAAALPGLVAAQDAGPASVDGGAGKGAPVEQPTSAIRLDPVAAQQSLAAGLGKLRDGEIGEAVELLKTAHAQDPANAGIANDLGYALMKLGARREAEVLYRTALDRDPRRALAYANLAELIGQSPERWQRQDEILGLLKKAVALLRDDAHGRVVVGLASAEFEQSVGRLGDARRRLEELLTQKPTGALRKRALDQLSAITEQERAAALADWPEPAAGDQATELRAIEKLLEAGQTAQALNRASALCDRYPTASEPRFVRARVLEAMGRHDETTRELMLMLQLRPSHAGGWRLLGMTLARHGGVLEAERADEALRRALALEPSWGDLRALRQRVAERRAVVRPGPPPVVRRPPSRQAQALLEEAHRLAGTASPEAARTPLVAALADSPAFVEAAVLLFSVTGDVPAATARALWDDGESLARLASELVRVRADAATNEVVKPWLDRAVALGSAEARFQRALLRADEADAAGALEDLAGYVASDINPPHLAEARALRRTVEGPPTGRGSTVVLARELLLADRARDARRTLGGTCRAGAGAEVLIELGRIEEYEGRAREALACHRLALAAKATTTADGVAERAALDRIARIAAQSAPAQAVALKSELEQGVRSQVPAAGWALARLHAADERWDEALALGERFVRVAAPADPLRLEAVAIVSGWEQAARQQRAARNARFGMLAIAFAAGALLLVTVLVARRFRGRTVAAALARVPDLYPDVAAAVGEIRHDVLKHRTSGLGLLGESVTAREEISRALHEPTLTSKVVADIYHRIERAAAAGGVALRPLAREPIFGPLHRTLARAETLITRVGNSGEIAAIDRALREQHGPALAALLVLVPQTRLDAAQVADWIRAVASEEPEGVVGHDAGARPPSRRAVTTGLQLPALDLDVPLTQEALYAIMSNLVRNAVAALDGAADPRVLVRVEQTRDALGRTLVTVVVADSAPATITLDEIDKRDGQRGLGVVRELVRRWGGHLIVRPEAPPFVKAIGAAFPLAAPPAVTP